ncbi:MAG: hypothetical protein ACLPGW_19665 [Roseiarcus sp.]
MSSGPREKAINWSALARVVGAAIGLAAASYFVLFVLYAAGAIGGASAVWNIVTVVFAVFVFLAVAHWMRTVRLLLLEIRDRLPTPAPASAAADPRPADPVVKREAALVAIPHSGPAEDVA